ncbi:hypothetical protein ABK040_000302 [Willaertia magna]
MSQMMEELFHTKKRKLMYLFSVDVLYEICNFIYEIEDYLHLAFTNKYFYKNLLKKEIIFFNGKYLLNNFTNLKFLNIKQIFKSENENIFEKLNQLEELYIFNRKDLQNNINVTKLNNLKILHISKCNDNILQNLINLTELNIKFSDKNFTGKYFCNLKQLKILHLYNTNVTDENLQKLNNLTELNISRCIYINGNFLKDLPNLQKLFCDCCLKKDTFKENIKNLIQLKELSFSHYKFNNIDSTFIKDLINLESLVLLGNNFKDEDFKNLKNLKHLYIEGKGLTGKCFKYLTKLEKLEGYIQDLKELKYIKNIKKLKCLDGDHCNEHVTDKDLIVFINLESLNINFCNEMKGDCLISFKYLTKLNISNLFYLEDKYLINLNNLKKLKMYNCHKIIGTCLQNLTNLEILNITNTKIDEKYLEPLINLKKLIAVDCNIPTGKFLLNMNKLIKFKFVKSLKFNQIEKIKKQIKEGHQLKDILIKY